MIYSPSEVTYKHNFGWRILLAGLALATVAWAGYLYYDGNAVEWFSAGTALVFVAVAVIGWLLIGRCAISVHPEGLVQVTAFGRQEAGWAEVTSYVYTQTPQNYGAHFGLIGMLVSVAVRKDSSGAVVSRRFKMKAADSVRIDVTANFRDSEDLIRRVLARLNPRFIEAAKAAMASSTGAEFGKIRITREGIIWKGKDIVPFALLSKFAIEGANLRMKAQGKWLDNSIALSKVPNVFVLLELVEQGRSAGVPSDPLRAAAGNAGIGV